MSCDLAVIGRDVILETVMVFVEGWKLEESKKALKKIGSNAGLVALKAESLTR